MRSKSVVPLMSLRAGAFEQLEVRVARHVLRALEHHVLEEMREAGAAGCFVRGADVVPEIDGHQRQPVILATGSRRGRSAA